MARVALTRARSIGERLSRPRRLQADAARDLAGEGVGFTLGLRDPPEVIVPSGLFEHVPELDEACAIGALGGGIERRFRAGERTGAAELRDARIDAHGLGVRTMPAARRTHQVDGEKLASRTADQRGEIP